jgi:UDP-N-acetylglucosamine--N-acetylmuramyl-(pentapeptide) pyrophosphoryl-undecaprenol N-acetylglucosamine transferase
MGESSASGLACLIAAGGTAGHVRPALAVAEALQQRGVSVSFAGSPDRVEARLVPEAGFPFDPFHVSGFPRRPGLALAKALAQAAAAPVECLQILGRRRPDVVLGGGGYVAGPMVLAARLRGIPAALTEADAHLGLANRLANPFASRVFLSFPVEGVEGSKFRVAGRPIPKRSLPVPQDEAKRRFELPGDGQVILVFGGSQGSRALNEATLEAFGADGPTVLHLAGERDYAHLAPRVSRPDYRLLAFTDDFGAALSASDLVIARAGGSIWEVAAAGKPALLVPYPHATADHQTTNARYFERNGGAVVIPEESLHLPQQALELLGDPPRMEAMSEAMLSLARPDAADVIAEELIELARG